MTLSIITINYNNRDGLQKTIDSVIAQTWTDYEWIVIDGGSTDGSKELIEQYQDHFAYWCSEPDNGVYNAMNKGIAKAIGDYLNFMNSGDCYYEAETLKNVFTKERKADILYGDCMSVFSDHEELIRYPAEMELYMLYGLPICHQALFCKASLLKNKMYDESYKICADWKFLLEEAMRDATYEYVECTVCKYDMDGMSSTHDELFRDEWQKVQAVIPEIVRRSMEHLNSYAGSRHTVRARLLLEKGGLVALITKVVLALLDKCFLRTDFKKYPYCD